MVAVTATTEHAKPLRVLCLHGFRTNAAVMMNQVKGLRAALGEHAEFIYLNGPRVAGGPSDDIIERLHASDKPFYEWMHARRATPDDPGFQELQWSWVFEHFEDAIDYMEAKLCEIGPVDIVLGFSQGAMLATVLTMLYAQRDGNPTKWWKLVICAGGSAIRAVNCRSWFETPSGRSIVIPIPSIHIIGKKDFFYNAGLRLVDQFDSHPATASSALAKSVFIHEQGHKFPTAEKNPGLYEEIARSIVSHCREREPHVDQLNHQPPSMARL